MKKINTIILVLISFTSFSQIDYSQSKPIKTTLATPQNIHLYKKSSETLNEVKQLIDELKREELNINIKGSLGKDTLGESKFEYAFNQINNMLQSNNLNLTKAVFLSEGAYYNLSDSKQEYYKFSRVIRDMASQISGSVDSKQKNNNFNLAQTVFRYLTDTILIQKKSEGRFYKSSPMKYDFVDPFGEEDIKNLFVSKLMYSKKGQCKSLPLLYLLIMEELGGEAYLSFSPEHTYIKCKNELGRLVNLELTNGKITSDAWVAASGYIKVEAIQSGIFMDTLNKKQVVANCLVDLARYYISKYGETEFVLKYLNKSLEIHPTNIHAVKLKSNYYTHLFQNKIKGCKADNEDSLKELCPELYKVYLQMHSMYDLIGKLGYEKIPHDIYKKWLNDIEKQKTKNR